MATLTLLPGGSWKEELTILTFTSRTKLVTIQTVTYIAVLCKSVKSIKSFVVSTLSSNRGAKRISDQELVTALQKGFYTFKGGEGRKGAETTQI